MTFHPVARPSERASVWVCVYVVGLGGLECVVLSADPRRHAHRRIEGFPVVFEILILH